MKRYHVQTLGCQMNAHDSRRIEETLLEEGYEPSDDPQEADLLVVNTCSIREKAEHKLLSLLGRLRPLKEARPGALLVVAGCVAQQEGATLLKKAPHIDVVIGPDNIPDLPALLKSREQREGPKNAIVHTVFDLDDPRFLNARPIAGRKETSAYVTVMKGCDERCTYCIVPTTRGSERYRDGDSIVGEIAQLVAGGVREITLLGQTVNSWHEPEGPSHPVASKTSGSTSRFAELLRRIHDEVPSLARLRYTSPHPRHLTDALIAAHAELPMLANHVHLPAQSGSDRVLRRMSRHYGRAEYIERAFRLLASRPGLTLSTDLIVGFPGETDADFEETLSLVQEVGFVAAFCFKYSPRPNTPALRLGDDIPEETKSARIATLLERIEEQQRAHLESLVGTTTEVLIESRGELRGRYRGRSSRNEIVHIDFAHHEGLDPLGQLVSVRIERAYRHSLEGVPMETISTFRPKRVRLPVAQGGQP